MTSGCAYIHEGHQGIWQFLLDLFDGLSRLLFAPASHDDVMTSFAKGPGYFKANACIGASDNKNFS